MKKIGLISSLGCLATIGGAFAAWTFGQLQLVQPDSMEITGVTFDSVIETSFKITTVETFTDAHYTIKQSGTSNVIWERTSETGNPYDVELTVKIVPDDLYAVITETTVSVKTIVKFEAIGEGETLLSLGAVTNNRVVLNKKVTLSESHMEEELGYTFQGHNIVNEDYIIDSPFKVQQYIQAFENTKISYVTTLTEVENSNEPIIITGNEIYDQYEEIDRPIIIEDGGTLTLVNGAINQGITVNGGGKLIIEDEGGDESPQLSISSNIIAESGSEVEINDGVIDGLVSINGATLIVNDGKVNGKITSKKKERSNIYIYGGTFNEINGYTHYFVIYDGEFNGFITNDSDVAYDSFSERSMVIYDGIFHDDIEVTNKANLKVYDGFFDGDFIKEDTGFKMIFIEGGYLSHLIEDVYQITETAELTFNTDENTKEEYPFFVIPRVIHSNPSSSSVLIQTNTTISEGTYDKRINLYKNDTSQTATLTIKGGVFNEIVTTGNSVVLIQGGMFYYDIRKSSSLSMAVNFKLSGGLYQYAPAFGDHIKLVDGYKFTLNEDINTKDALPFAVVPIE